MREIKFRVWLNEENHYLYDGFGFFQNADGIEIYNDDGDEVTNFVVEQYTGLKDKNGEEIYEGDIMRFDGNLTGKVFFEQGGFQLISKQYKFIPPILLTEANMRAFEIIGNIHENADLLKEETK